MNRAQRFYATASFYTHETGGGCTAFRRDINAMGLHILLTAKDDSAAPTSEQQPVTVGLYADGADHSEPLATFNADDGEDALRKISAGLWDSDIVRSLREAREQYGECEGKRVAAVTALRSIHGHLSDQCAADPEKIMRLCEEGIKGATS